MKELHNTTAPRTVPGHDDHPPDVELMMTVITVRITTIRIRIVRRTHRLMSGSTPNVPESGRRDPEPASPPKTPTAMAA